MTLQFPMETVAHWDGASTGSSAWELLVGAVAATGPRAAYTIDFLASEAWDCGITSFSFDASRVAKNDAVPVWSDADLVIATFGLNVIRDQALRIGREIFGDHTYLRPAIDIAPETGTPLLVFEMVVPRHTRHLRQEFIARYVANTSIPRSAPVPVFVWTNQHAMQP